MAQFCIGVYIATSKKSIDNSIRTNVHLVLKSEWDSLNRELKVHGTFWSDNVINFFPVFTIVFTLQVLIPPWVVSVDTRDLAWQIERATVCLSVQSGLAWDKQILIYIHLWDNMTKSLSKVGGQYKFKTFN